MDVKRFVKNALFWGCMGLVFVTVLLCFASVYAGEYMGDVSLSDYYILSAGGCIITAAIFFVILFLIS